MNWISAIRISTLTLAVCLASASLPAHAADVPDNIRRAVAEALGTSSVAEAQMFTAVKVPEDVDLLASGIASDHSTGGVRVKLSCVPSVRCLPFYVLVKGTGFVVPSTHEHTVGNTAPDVRAGDRGTLISNSSSSMRITLPVTALDSGRVGDVIRVRFEKRLIWRARVLGPASFTTLAEAQ